MRGVGLHFLSPAGLHTRAVASRCNCPLLCPCPKAQGCCISPFIIKCTKYGPPNLLVSCLAGAFMLFHGRLGRFYQFTLYRSWICRTINHSPSCFHIIAYVAGSSIFTAITHIAGFNVKGNMIHPFGGIAYINRIRTSIIKRVNRLKRRAVKTFAAGPVSFDAVYID